MALDAADAFVWHPSPAHLAPVKRVSRVAIDLLQGVERQKQILLENTERFARGLPANNAMLWGARGMGKSSLVKAVHAVVNHRDPGRLVLIEIHREDIRTLPDLLNLLREQDRRCLILCDDLSFEREDSDYKALKSILEGGIEGRPDNVLFYATSNRRHLMSRDMIENERSTAINPSEAIEEKVSLSDRFGLWLGFHNCDQDTFFAMIEGYAAALRLPIETGGAAGAGGGVVDDPRLPVGAGGMAVHPGPGRAAGDERARGEGRGLLQPARGTIDRLCLR